MDHQPTKEEIAEYKEAFSLFDKDGDGVIDIQYLAMLIRSLNKNPTEEELQVITLEVDPHLTNKVEFPDFVTAMAKRNQEVDPVEEIQDAFRQLHADQSMDKGMPIQTLRHHLQRGNNSFSDTEFEEMVRLLGPKDSEDFRIDKFIQIVVNSMEQNKIR